jgi:hypothetical protein
MAYEKFAGPLMALGCAALAVGCSGSARAKVVFEHQSAQTAGGQALTLADGTTPSVFGAKIVNIYLAQEVDAQMRNGGDMAHVWSHPLCDADLRLCGIGPEHGTHEIKDYFDLALPSEEVNARLNAQAQEIKTGTFNYVRLDLSGVLKDTGGKNDPSVHNMIFGDVGATHEVRLGQNGVTIRLENPLVLEDGDSVVVSLQYNLAGSYYTASDLSFGVPPAGGSLNDWYCADSARFPSGPCLNMPAFVPSVKLATAKP